MADNKTMEIIQATVVDCDMGEGRTGNGYYVVECELVTGERVRCYTYLTDATMPRVLDELALLGYPHGFELDYLAKDHPEHWSGAGIELSVIKRPNSDPKYGPQYNIATKGGGSATKPLDNTKVKQYGGKLKAFAASQGQKPSPAKPKSGPAPKPADVDESTIF